MTTDSPPSASAPAPSFSDSTPDPAYGRKVMLMAFGATSSMIIGVSSIMPLVPRLGEIFGVPHTTASLIITAFTLPGIFFAPLGGILADRYGRRPVLIASLILFCLSGVGCAFAPDFNSLVFLRFLQGMGAAPLGVLNTTIIADTYPRKDVSRYIGYNMSVLSICTALYPTIGGLLGHLNWRFAFLLSLMSLPALLIALRTPLANPGANSTLRQYFADAAHAFHERRILVLLGMTAVTFIMLYGPIVTCFPALAHHRFNATPATIGGVMFFASVGSGITAAFLGKLSVQFSPLCLLLCSQILYVLALFLLPECTELWWMAGPVILYGIGQGLNIPTLQAQLLQATPAAQRASVMAANGMLLRLGQTVAPLAFSSLMLWQGLSAGFHVGIALAAVLFVMAVVFLKKTK